MKKQTIIAFVLFTLLTTVTFQEKLKISKFNLKEIKIENNLVLKESYIKNLLLPIYNKNLIFLKDVEVKELLMQNTFIESFIIKKKYPNVLKIKIFEKKPIAILQNKKKKFYLSKKIELIEFNDLNNYKELPYVFGNKREFKIFYNNLSKIEFPFDMIKTFTLFESNRWDLETINKKLIKLPHKDYTKSLRNYLHFINKNDLNKYKVFDYRINGQLILK